MPELPEVETVARGLRHTIQGKAIRRITVFEQKKFRGSPSQLRRYVIGRTISDIARYGKWLVIKLASHYGFVIHLKMTGQLLYQTKRLREPKFLGGHTMVHDKRSGITALPNSHTRVMFTMSDGSELFFQDMRKFGYVELYSPDELTKYFIDKKLGIEPLDTTFNLKYWEEQLKRHPATSVKAVLLNQSIVAGIGNIYADDICWVAKVKPTRRVRSLSVAQRLTLYRACQKVISEGIKFGGTSFSHYYRVDGSLGQYWNRRKVYGRTYEPCRRCQSTIIKTRCAGRGTHYCPRCQK